MNKQVVFEYFGSVQATADALGIRPPSIYSWKDDLIPLDRAFQVQIITVGRLSIDISDYSDTYKFDAVHPVRR